MASEISRMSSSLSSTSTLIPSAVELQKPIQAVRQSPYDNPHTQASHIVEFVSSLPQNSFSVYIYDVAEQVGFGTLTKEWTREQTILTPTFDLQTRPGAGLALVGRLSQGTSHDSVDGAVLTAYTTPGGLATMAPSLAYLPAASLSSRLIIQVPNVSAVGEALSFSPTYAPLASVWSILPQNIAVLLSATPQQTADFASMAYKVTDTHVIHLFDHFSSGRETGAPIHPPNAEIQSKPTSLQAALQDAAYDFFEYHGGSSAHIVLVLLNGPLAQVLKTLVRRGIFDGLGVIIVNVLRPWSEDNLKAVIPSSVTSIHVLDDVPNAVTQGALYADVFSSLWTASPKHTIHGHRITPNQTNAFLGAENSFIRFVASISRVLVKENSHVEGKKVLLFSVPRSSLSTLPYFIEDMFSGKKGLSVRNLVDNDVFSKPGGITVSRLLISRGASENTLPLDFTQPLNDSTEGVSDFLGILDQSLLKSHTVLRHAKRGSTVLLISSWTSDELQANLSASSLSLIAERSIKIFTLDAKAFAKELITSTGPAQDAIQNLIVELAFLRLYLAQGATEEALLKLVHSSFSDVVQGIALSQLNAVTWSALKAVDLVGTTPVAEEGPALKDFQFNAIAVETDEGKTVVNGARLSSWHDAAKHLLFPAVYTPQQDAVLEDSTHNPALRPEVPETTFLVTCTVNKRLTPLEYDRNVFHLEFDTSGTGLKYAIGEALGVHGWNDEQEVLEFCSWYGVDPNRLITIPLPSDEMKFHTRTVLQALQQQVDIFGHPPKSFYTDLAEYATKDVDRYALRFIGSPEGSSTFKKFSEKDTVTFADVLQKYPSARPGIERLCELIEDIKPRHYSIASAQAVVGDRVDLLVVTVDWITPSGTPRYGQCTRYLAGLKVGQKATVSIKPSVMKLPPNPKQPLIMAGLGTGAAPFRAFLQYLSWRQERGEEIGPVYYYFGSRYQAAEYLYGEEIEAFILDGVISRAGLAFSRDGPKKVYIQHKMLEDSEQLAKMLHDEEGAFYLCGPTWPVPDVYEALVNALVKYQSLSPTKAGDYLEGLKEEERYVLEVY